MAAQPRGDEAPQLVQPHWGGEQQSGDRGDLQLKYKGIGDTGECQGDVAALGSSLRDDCFKGRGKPGEDGVVVNPPDHHRQHDGE